MNARLRRLKPALDRLYADYDRAAAVADPVEIVRRYRDPADREVAGFLAAALAFGRVAGVLQTIERVLAVAGPAPASFVRTFDPTRHTGAFRSIVHRWTSGTDIATLVWIVGRMIESAGSIESYFLEGDDPASDDVGPGIDSLSRRALAWAGQARGRVPAPRGGAAGPGVSYFFPRPSNGSACKRLNLFLRWMVRRDAVDPGGWSRVSRSRLVIPLDVHVIRVGRCLRLTLRTSPGWGMATDITRSLRAIDPEDPVRYDFALCHLGMQGLCGFGTAQGDRRCPLRDACRARGADARYGAGGRPRRSARTAS